MERGQDYKTATPTLAGIAVTAGSNAASKSNAANYSVLGETAL